MRKHPQTQKLQMYCVHEHLAMSMCVCTCMNGGAFVCVCVCVSVCVTEMEIGITVLLCNMATLDISNQHHLIQPTIH